MNFEEEYRIYYNAWFDAASIAPDFLVKVDEQVYVRRVAFGENYLGLRVEHKGHVVALFNKRLRRFMGWHERSLRDLYNRLLPEAVQFGDVEYHGAHVPILKTSRTDYVLANQDEFNVVDNGAVTLTLKQKVTIKTLPKSLEKAMRFAKIHIKRLLEHEHEGEPEVPQSTRAEILSAVDNSDCLVEGNSILNVVRTILHLGTDSLLPPVNETDDDKTARRMEWVLRKDKNDVYFERAVNMKSLQQILISLLVIRKLTDTGLVYPLDYTLPVYANA